MKKTRLIRYLLLILTIIICLIVSSCNKDAITDNDYEDSVDEISWVSNEDGTVTCTNNMGNGNSVYAWYVLNESNEAIIKTQYIEDNSYTFNLGELEVYSIKGFVRNYDENMNYEQYFYVLRSTEILDQKGYVASETSITDNTISALHKKITAKVTNSLTTEEVLNRDGSRLGIDISIPMDWSCKSITNRSMCYRTNYFQFLDETYRAYLEENNSEYADIIMEYIIDWVKQNPVYDKSNEWVWHDDATALRLLRMSVYYSEFKDKVSHNDRKLIEQSLAFQAELLASEEFYTHYHNHGMHQDIALIVYALLFEESEKQEQHFSIALSRTAEYLDYVYTEDGIHKEHSPDYAKDVLSDMVLIRDIFVNSAPEFCQHINKYIDGAEPFLIQLIKPDGYWPGIGDSTSKRGIDEISLIPFSDDYYRYVITGGVEGKAPNSSAVFQDGGYAMFRSSWDMDKDNSTWMMMTAATFSSTHKHGDDLEVLLYHKGDLFVEGGRRNFNYSESETSWTYSGYAHNVLLVDDKPYPVNIGENGFQSILPEALDTKIIDYSISDDISQVTGYEHRFQDIEHKRTLTYKKNSNQVTVADELLSDIQYKGTLQWHVASGVKVVECSDGWEFYRDSQLIAQMKISADVDYSLSTIYDDNQYPFVPWIFDGNEKSSLGTLLLINFMADGDVKITEDVSLK